MAVQPVRRAVVGAGAWGTTLAVMLARTGPVTLLARDRAQAARLHEDRANERYLPYEGKDVHASVSDLRGRAARDELAGLA